MQCTSYHNFLHKKIPYLHALQENGEMGVRYLDPKYSRWISVDPALGEYVPQAPVNDEAKKQNQNLPGMGGVFNSVNLSLYHYAGNNPVKYVDPNGKENVYFIYTYGEDDFAMVAGEFWSQLGNIIDTFLLGLSIKIIMQGTQADILRAIQDPECYALITSGHGSEDGKICTASGSYFTPSDIDKSDVSKNLQLVIFENCYQGLFEKEWEEAFGGNVDVVGWKGTTNTLETISFNTVGIFDRKINNMHDYLSKIKFSIWMDRFQKMYDDLYNKKMEDYLNE